MTTVAAYLVPGRGCHIFSDTQITDGTHKAKIKTKWITHNGWAIGTSGYLKTITTIDYHRSAIFTSKVKHPMDIVNKIADLILEKDEEEGTETDLNNFLLTNGDALWAVGTVRELLEVDHFYIGSGSPFAMGADSVLAEVEEDPVERVRKAMAVASELDPFTNNVLWEGLVPAKSKIRVARK